MKLLVAITGASGVIYGIRLLEELKKKKIETYLILSNWGARTIKIETTYDVQNVKDLAKESYGEEELSAKIASGSFRTDGMIIAPCSMKTLAAIANGYAANLVGRVADVVLKEKRKLLLVVRETPLNPIHLENMLKLARIGVVIFPPVPAFYTKPVSLDDVTNHTVGRILDHFNIESGSFQRWSGENPLKEKPQ